VRFCWGFCENGLFGCGFLLVSLWWKCGESWLVHGHFLGLRNFPRLLDLFFVVPILGIGVGGVCGQSSLHRDERTGSQVMQEAMPVRRGTGIAPAT
jgi:hypothetical protein